MKTFVIVILALAIFGKINDLIDCVATVACEGDTVAWNCVVLFCYSLSLLFVSLL